MADDNSNKGSVIIKKKISGGHGGGHGGAWKVAYADFVTAMMAFFLVMWLMGADEETKINVSNYFNDYTPYQASNAVNNNGSDSAGDASWRTDGSQGRYEEDIVTKPSRTVPVYLDEQKVIKEIADTQKFDGASFTKDNQGDKVMLQVPGSVSFRPGSALLSHENYQYLNKMAPVFTEYTGHIEIQGNADESDLVQPDIDLFKLAFDRAVVVRDYLASNKVSSKKMIPLNNYRPPVDEKTRAPASDPNRTARFILRHIRSSP